MLRLLPSLHVGMLEYALTEWSKIGSSCGNAGDMSCHTICVALCASRPPPRARLPPLEQSRCLLGQHTGAAPPIEQIHCLLGQHTPPPPSSGIVRCGLKYVTWCVQTSSTLLLFVSSRLLSIRHILAALPMLKSLDYTSGWGKKPADTGLILSFSLSILPLVQNIRSDTGRNFLTKMP